MGEEKLGIENLKAVLALGLSCGNALGNTLEDGKIGFTDAIFWFNTLQKAGPAYEAMPKAWPEWKDLDDSEKEQLKSMITEDFDIPQDSIEPAIEKGLHIGVELMSYVTEFFSKKSA